MLSTHPRFNASAEVLRGEQFVQIYRDVRKGEGVVFAAHATAKIPQQFVVNLREAMIINEFMAREPRCLEERGENVLKHLHS